MATNNYESAKQTLIGRKGKNKTCLRCKSTFHRLRDLHRHEKNRKEIHCLHCDSTFCNNDHFQKHLRTISHSGGTVIDYELAINTNSGCENEPEFQELIKQKASEINDSVKVYSNYKVINKKIDEHFTYGDLDTLLSDIYSTENNSFKANLNFGYVIRNIITGEFRYHYVSSNTLLFEHAITITNQRDIDKFVEKVFALDLANNYYLQRPSSAWILAALTNIQMCIYTLKDVPIGRPPIDLPDYIRNSRAINSLVRDGNNREIKDNFCFFRCLSLHRGNSIRCLERSTKTLKRELENVTGLCYNNGVQISHIPEIERTFEVSVNVYTLNIDGHADIIYLSKLKFPPMHVNLYKNHFCYIKNMNTFAKRFQCQMCEMIFDRNCSLSRHVKSCCTEQSEIYDGGKYKRDMTLFERLELAGYVVPKADRYYEYVSCYDFEAMLVKRSEKLKGREIVQQHIPATFSVHSNVPGCTQVQHRVSSGNPQTLVDELIRILRYHQQSASREVHQKYQSTFIQLDADPRELEEKLEAAGDPIVQKYNSKCHKKLQTLQRSLEKYCNEHVVLSFNGSRYDIPLIKRYLASSLKRLDELPPLIINKDGGYMVIVTSRLKFLDLTNYLAAGTNLAAFYKAYGVKDPKACFPYEWFDSLEKLDARYLPKQEDFYSLLTNSNADNAEYESALDAWCLHGWETFRQYLEYYNNLDVTGMTQAVEKMFKVYKDKDLDLFKEGFSLAGITQKYVFKNLPDQTYFSQFGKEHAHIYKELRAKGVCGGPSIVFTRYHEAGLTKIRGGQTCRKVIGFDCNSMYLNCTSMPMATGWYTLREKKDGYKVQSRYSKEAIQWL